VNVLKEHGAKESNIILLNLFSTPNGEKLILEMSFNVE
jgi:hypothetical protein